MSSLKSFRFVLACLVVVGLVLPLLPRRATSEVIVTQVPMPAESDRVYATGFGMVAIPGSTGENNLIMNDQNSVSVTIDQVGHFDVKLQGGEWIVPAMGKFNAPFALFYPRVGIGFGVDEKGEAFLFKP